MTKFLYRNLAGHRVLLSLAVALTFLQAGSTVFMAFPLKWIVDKLVNNQDPAVPFADSLIGMFDGLGHDAQTPGHHTVFAVIVFASITFFVLGLVGAGAAWGQLSIASRIARELGARLRSDLFRHVGTLRLAWHDRQRTGDIVQRISGNITEIEKLVADGLVDLLSGVLTLVGMIIVLFLLSWQFTLISMIIVPPLFVVVAVYTRTIKAASKATAKAAGQVADVATESVGAITELKAFTLEDWSADAFQRRVDEQRAAFGRAGHLQAQFSPWVLVLVALSNLAIISLGGWVAAGNTVSLGVFSIPAGSLTVGSLTVFVTYSKQLYQPMRDLAKLMLLASNGAVACERIQEMLDQEPEPDRVALPDPSAAEPVRGDVRYEGVSFGYEGGRPVLHRVDLAIPVGKRVALVGLSGSGKTTLVKLLPRFYDPWEGCISIGDTDVRNLSLPELRRSIGFVLQDSVLFEGAIRDNIAIGRSDATDEEIVLAAQRASIHDLIVSLPGGYEAEVREHGKNFSSGQRQRIAIARAIVRDAPILVLDEPTANLDVEAEAEVMRALEELVEGRTVLVISHRLSTLGQVDEIAVLDHGRIVERGSYAELAASQGRFARMLAQQSRYAPSAAASSRRRAAGPPGNGAHGAEADGATRADTTQAGREPVAAASKQRVGDPRDSAGRAKKTMKTSRSRGPSRRRTGRGVKPDKFCLTVVSVRIAYAELRRFDGSALSDFFADIHDSHSFERFEQHGTEGAEMSVEGERYLAVDRRSLAYQENAAPGVEAIAGRVSDLMKEMDSHFRPYGVRGPAVDLRLRWPIERAPKAESCSEHFRQRTLNIDEGGYAALKSATPVGSTLRFAGTTEDPHAHFSFVVEPGQPDGKALEVALEFDFTGAEPIASPEEAGERVIAAHMYLRDSVVPFLESLLS
jgi:ATP-binding cassette subfamily B protein